MSGSHPTVIAEKFLRLRLAGNATLSQLPIWSGFAPSGSVPDGAGAKWVTFQEQSPGGDALGPGATTFLSAPTYLVTVWGETGSFLDLSAEAQAIHDALHNASADVDGYHVTSYREGPYSQVDDQGSITYRRLGGFYPLRITPGAAG